MIDFLYTVGLLKRTPRSGWLTIGVKDCESVAEHSFRCAVLGYLLAKMENANPEKTALLCLFHDLPEALTGDLHLIARKYLSKNSRKLIKDTVRDLENGDEISSLLLEYEKGKTKEAIIAKDADKLEMLLQAKEYSDSGIKNTEKFILTAKKQLKTKSAKKLASEAEKTQAYGWLISHDKHDSA